MYKNFNDHDSASLGKWIPSLQFWVHFQTPSISRDQLNFDQGDGACARLSFDQFEIAVIATFQTKLVSLEPTQETLTNF